MLSALASKTFVFTHKTGGVKMRDERKKKYFNAFKSERFLGGMQHFCRKRQKCGGNNYYII